MIDNSTFQTIAKNFMGEIALKLKDSKVASYCHENVITMPLIKNTQCMYVINWKQSELTYIRGVNEMLGYKKEEFNISNIINYTHPDDVVVVMRVVMAYISHTLNTDLIDKELKFNSTYRLLKKDGTYMRILRQSSPYEIGASGKIISHLSILTDITFIENEDHLVKWDIYSNNTVCHDFKDLIYKDFIDFFTPRELEIILLIKEENTNKRIAEKLFISFHTVVAHRKNILLKSGCHNTKELLLFASNNGII